MNSPTTCKPALNNTAKKILNAAEVIFIEKGYAATSLRSISSSAGVNLSATHYHFGSKEGLFEAVIDRHIQPLTQRRFDALDNVLKDGHPITVEKIARAFLSPMLEGTVSQSLPKLLARLYGEPESMTRPLLIDKFGTTASRFVDALAIALPLCSKTELLWRFHFMVGAMIQLFNFDHPLSIEPVEESPEAGIDKLLSFVIAGLTQ